MRNTATLFELKIIEPMHRPCMSSLEFDAMTDCARKSFHDLVESESCASSTESSPDEDSHPSHQCNIVIGIGRKLIGRADDGSAAPPIQHMLGEQEVYELDKIERAKACKVDLDREQERIDMERATLNQQAKTHVVTPAVHVRAKFVNNGSSMNIASKNIATAAAMTQSISRQANPEDQHIVDEPKVLLEVAACKHGDSSDDRRR